MVNESRGLKFYKIRTSWFLLQLINVLEDASASGVINY